MSPVNGGFIRGNEPKDNLLVGDLHFTDSLVLDENQDLQRGSVLGIKTSNERAVLSDDGAADGSETPKYILLEDAVTGAGESLTISVLTFGQVNQNALLFGGTHDEDSVKEPLRNVGIYTVDSSPA